MSMVLSIIIPVYNMEKYLHQCLDSVLSPDREGEYEVIVVNDGSTDNSLNIIEKYSLEYPSIFKVIDKPNGGYGSCFNIGIKVATGKYFKMLDSDDWFLASAFPSYIDMLMHQDEDVIVNGVLEVEDGNLQGKSNLKAFPYSQGNKINLNDPLYSSMFIHNFAFRTNMMKDCACPQKLLYTDTIITLHGLHNVRSAYCCGKDLYCYRIGRSGQSTDKVVALRRLADYLEVADLVYKRYSDLGCSLIAREVSAYQFERISYCCLKGICSKKISIESLVEYRKIYKRMVCFCKHNNYSLQGKTMRLSARIPFFYLIWHFRLKSRC